MKTELIQFIAQELLGGQSNTPLLPEDDLLTNETIDSMGVMRLIAFIEERYGVQIPPEDVTVENFISVDAISSYLAVRRAS